MNIANIKKFLGVASLDFQRVLDKDGVATVWYKAWINSSRTSILVHEDMKDKLATSVNLSLKDKGVSTSKNGEEYRTYVIVEFNHVEFSV